MGKILEYFGIIEGYDMMVIKKKKSKNDSLFEEIEKYDNNIKEDIRKIVNESLGKVFAVVKNKKIKGVYLFETTLNDDVRILKHIKTVYTDEVPADIHEKYKNFILRMANDYITLQEYDEVILEDRVIKVKTKGKKRAITESFAIGFIFGWIVFDSLIWAFIWGFVCSSIEVIMYSRNGRKKRNDK